MLTRARPGSASTGGGPLPTSFLRTSSNNLVLTNTGHTISTR